MIRHILRWLRLVEPENHLTPEMEQAVAAIFTMNAFRAEHGYEYTNRLFH
jgi:hypothetical protein